MKEAGHIKAKTKWKALYPLIGKEERYLNLLGCPGSNPLELFWDVVDDMDQKLEAKERDVRRVLGKAGLEFNENTPYEEYRSALTSTADDEVAKLEEEDLKEVYESVSRCLLFYTLYAGH